MTHVNVKTKLSAPLFDGVVVNEWIDESGFSCVQIRKDDDSLTVVSERYYDIELSEDLMGEQENVPPKDQAPVEPTAPVGAVPAGGMGAVAPMPVAKAKSKETLSSEDIERVITKVSDVSLTTLKSIGLKSGELYPLMIKINDALRATLSHKKEKKDG